MRSVGGRYSLRKLGLAPTVTIPFRGMTCSFAPIAVAKPVRVARASVVHGVNASLKGKARTMTEEKHAYECRVWKAYKAYERKRRRAEVAYEDSLRADKRHEERIKSLSEKLGLELTMFCCPMTHHVPSVEFETNEKTDA